MMPSSLETRRAVALFYAPMQMGVRVEQVVRTALTGMPLPGSRWRSLALSGFRAMSGITVALLLFAGGETSVALAQDDTDDEDFLLLELPGIISKQNQDTTTPPTTGSSGGGVPVTGELSYRQTPGRLIVTSTQPPTWRLEFATGSGSPGGGVAIGFYIPADSQDSVVETVPRRMCCSGLGLDNIEWRHRPFGGTAGVRGDLGGDATVNSFRIVTDTPRRLDFEMTGSWRGVSNFTRRTIITPKGFHTNMTATYSGDTGRESMWWIMSLFHESRLDSDNVTIEDSDTAPQRLRKTLAGTHLPSGISIPYTINYPLLRPRTPIRMTMKLMADDSGAARFYEYFDNGNAHGINIGPYYLIYPRWTSVFQHRTYSFQYDWQLTP